MNVQSFSEREQPFLIAEIGSAHEGDFDVALQMVREAARSGADAVKFQTYRARELVRADLPALGHVAAKYRFQYERFEALEFSEKQYKELHALCGELGIHFLSTPFDEASADMLAPLVPAFKVASGDVTHHRLLERLASYDKPVFLSTGMADAEEIRAALAILGKERTVLLHCVSLYPTPDRDANLLSIPWLRETFGVAAGYSDHTVGIEACVGAAALGACVIEKHFTLDKTIAFGDHRLAADPADFLRLAGWTRRMGLLRGRPGKFSADAGMRGAIRRGAVAAAALKAGDALTREAVRLVRPAEGIPASDIASYYGRILQRDVQEGEVLLPEFFG